MNSGVLSFFFLIPYEAYVPQFPNFHCSSSSLLSIFKKDMQEHNPSHHLHLKGITLEAPKSKNHFQSVER